MKNDEFYGMLLAESIRAVASLYFFIKFLGFACWYRNSSKGNIMERSVPVFYMRNLFDVILYCFLGYSIYLDFCFRNSTRLE